MTPPSRFNPSDVSFRMSIWTTLPLWEGLKIRQDFQGRGSPPSANGSPSVFPLTPPRNSLRKFRPSHRGRVGLKLNPWEIGGSEICVTT